MAREINLVPDIKNEMIKALKMRNFIFFISFIIAVASVGLTLVVGTIMGGQQLALSGKQTTLDKLSKKLNSYGDLSEFLTFQGQIDNIEGLIDDKKVLSRTFNVLSALLPTGADTITISELNVRFGDNTSFTFSARANAGKEPYIDYNVLDSFKKSMQYMRYDYGNYVDKNGDSIPAYCMIETGSDGAIFTDPDKGVYAYWNFNLDGCSKQSFTDKNSETNDETLSEETPSNTNLISSEYTIENFEGKDVIRIWRTPQYAEWYSESETEGKPYMSLNGEIKNVAHFKSSCISYSGSLTDAEKTPKWKETNDSCLLVPDGTNGIKISSSSNGRDSNGELVLIFDATISLNPDVFSFNKKHVLALAPSGRHNVTDSYVQIQSMFGERATECSEDDSLCQSNTENLKGEE